MLCLLYIIWMAANLLQSDDARRSPCSSCFYADSACIFTEVWLSLLRVSAKPTLIRVLQENDAPWLDVWMHAIFHYKQNLAYSSDNLPMCSAMRHLTGSLLSLARSCHDASQRKLIFPLLQLCSGWSTITQSRSSMEGALVCYSSTAIMADFPTSGRETHSAIINQLCTPQPSSSSYSSQVVSEATWRKWKAFQAFCGIDEEVCWGCSKLSA